MARNARETYGGFQKGAKRSELRLRKKQCLGCQNRRARFYFAGRVRWDRFHSLCFRCYRSLSDRVRSTLALVTQELPTTEQNLAQGEA